MIMAMCSPIISVSDGNGIKPPIVRYCWDAFPNVSVSVDPSDEPGCFNLVFKSDQRISVDHDVGAVELTGSRLVCPENLTTYEIIVSSGSVKTTDYKSVSPDNVTVDLGYLQTMNKSDFSISNVADGDRVPQILTLMGTCPTDLKEDIWVFVVAPNGLYYPQSPDACNISWRTPKVNGRWEARVGFGQPEEVGEYFGLVLTVADQNASRDISDTLNLWCEDGVYTGWKRLPPGVAEAQRITVVRNAEIWAPAPNISNANLHGEVSFINISKNDPANPVPVQMNIDGNCTSDHEGDIWVLVYPTSARWYPQSISPCGGVHTFEANETWRTTVTFGGVDKNIGEPFDIVAVLANRTASNFFDKKQREWCEADNYTGYLTIELPQGIEEKDRVRVYRK
ncbi:MAG TPA: hypothetical protein PLZ42_01580 [Methanothrix sp.]|nr:hypothetical protein [Methanothrix sp.]